MLCTLWNTQQLYYWDVLTELYWFQFFLCRLGYYLLISFHNCIADTKSNYLKKKTLGLIELCTGLENYYKKTALSPIVLSSDVEKNLKSEQNVELIQWVVKKKNQCSISMLEVETITEQ